MTPAVISLREVVMDVKDNRAEWVEFFERSGLTQLEFEKRYGVSARTLRSWRRKFRAGRQPPAEAVTEVLEQAIEALTAIRASLVAAERQSCAEEKATEEACHLAEQATREHHAAGSPEAVPTRGPSTLTAALPSSPPAPAANEQTARHPAAGATGAPMPSTATSAVTQPPCIGQPSWSTFGAGLNWG